MKVIRWLDEHIEEFFLVFFSIVMVVVIAVQVFMRYVLSSSLSWSEELARYCFIWLVYFGISYGVKKQRHIKVDVALLLLKERGMIVLQIGANLLFLGFALFVIFYGVDIAQRLLSFGQTSPALQIPMGLVYLATPIGMGLTALRLVQQIMKQFKALAGEGSFKVKTEQEIILEEQSSDKGSRD
ncbi:TRAP transporter small permease [Halalkalibacterium halodurans]|uniref:TRAP transporter small permease n=1 Tax=Halalkalibacterium halodurans TaxID=86665 RepID=UPI002AA9CFD5|nr:TRAP transporter small permease [Halalkalibacterium halodurans]MDY7223206.1 TRAP transporter small permease [Halalkalibacterium halodurans]MDY7242427.1 TRAP transporter small permease [Halalkalibacterium halodurans]